MKQLGSSTSAWALSFLGLAIGCTKPPPSEDSASTATAHPAVATVASGVARSAGSANPSTSLSASPLSAEPGHAFPRVPGIGSTRADWEATHTRYSPPSHATTPGAIFGPVFAEPKAEGGLRPTYEQVDGDKRIFNYELNMPPTTFEKALARLLAELPADAKEVKRRALRGCRQIRYRSATLDTIFTNDPSAHASGYSGEVDVEFMSEDPEVMDVAAVNTVIVGFFGGEEIDHC